MNYDFKNDENLNCLWITNNSVISMYLANILYNLMTIANYS